MNHYKIGFIGTGNLAQALIKGMIEKDVVFKKNIFAYNRSPGKLKKVVEHFGIQECSSNEDVIERSDAVILAMKPQDLYAALEPIASYFNPGQIVISLAAGVSLEELEKRLPDCRVVRLMPNTPISVNRGVLGYVSSEKDLGAQVMIEDLFSPLGYVVQVEDEEQLEALTVSCASGTGFVYELMMYWQDWIEERGFDPEVAKKMTIETFLGAALLAVETKDHTIEDLQNKVTSKKGVTAAGLESIRELEVERALRYSFEKAALRNQELAKQK